MSDPLERMAGFRSDVEGGPMLPADEVRRRGDRIRRRRHTAIAVGSALAVAVIVAPIALLTAGGSPDRVQPAPEPATPTQAEDASALTEANLMTEDDTEYDGEATWRGGRTFSGDGPVVANPCQQQSYGELGAGAVFQRDWFLEAHGLHQAVAEFASAADAETAYDRLVAWQTECTPPQTEGFQVGRDADVAIPVDGAAHVVDARFRMLGVEEGGEAFAEQRMITGIAVSGNRLTVLTHNLPDGDYSQWWTVPPVERMLPAAATRLVAAPATATTDAGDPSGGALPDESLSVVDPGLLPAVPRMDPWESIPSQSDPTLACQGGWLSSLGADEVVTGERRAGYPDAGADVASAKVNVAVLQYADAAAAGAAYDTVAGWLEECPASQTDVEPNVDVRAAPVEVAISGVERAHQVRVVYGAPEACGGGDCDAAWFDHQTVAQAGDRLVLVTYAEAAGPCPPGDVNGDTCTSEEAQQPWLDRAQLALEAAVGGAIPDTP
jgi:hypothetical protein